MNRKMTTFFIILIAVGGLLVVGGTLGLSLSSGKEDEQRHDSLIEQGNDIKSKIDNSVNKGTEQRTVILDKIEDIDKKANQVVSNTNPKNNRISNEDFTITINKFDLPNPLFNVEITYTNEGASNVFISDVQLIFSQPPLKLESGAHFINSHIVYPQDIQSITIESQKYTSKNYTFGKSIDELKGAIRNFNGLPFKIQLKLTLSSINSGSYYYIIPLSKEFTVSHKYDSFFSQGIGFPLNVKLLPYKECTTNIDDKYKIN